MAYDPPLPDGIFPALHLVVRVGPIPDHCWSAGGGDVSSRGQGGAGLASMAKSLAWFLPWLLIWGIFIVVGLRRTATVLVTVLWVAMFYFMAGDLISVGFAGYHLWDYFPHIEDILNSPEQHIWQWAGEELDLGSAHDSTPSSWSPVPHVFLLPGG